MMHHLFICITMFSGFFANDIRRSFTTRTFTDFNNISVRFLVNINDYQWYCILFWCNNLIWKVIVLQQNDISSIIYLVWLRVIHNVTVRIMVKYIANHYTLQFLICYLWCCISFLLDSYILSPYYQVIDTVMVYAKAIFSFNIFLILDPNKIYPIH